MTWYDVLIYGPVYGDCDFNQCIIWILGYSVSVIWIGIWNQMHTGYCLKEILLRKSPRKIWLKLLADTVVWSMAFGLVRMIPRILCEGFYRMLFIIYAGYCVNTICIVMIGITIEWLMSAKAAFCILAAGCTASAICVSFGINGSKILIWNLGMGFIAEERQLFIIMAVIFELIIIGMGFVYCKKLLFHSLEKSEEYK
ncbi:MAG: hypothetical protein ACI4EW_05595 [Butyrivibrio sp.]